MKIFLLIIFLLVIFAPQLVSADQIIGQQTAFNIESNYDLEKRSQLTAVLIKISSQLYWYADDNWWLTLPAEEKEKTLASLNILTEEFEGNAYPVLTGTFGDAWNPGIDKDTRITILAHQMSKGTGGYSDMADEYPKVQIPESNEREMVYLNAQYINTGYAKSFLAHEFVHLITFNQKDKKYGVSEDVWLNEARAEYAPTLLGYDTPYEGSNLQRRVKDFLDKPSDSLTEWRETTADYGVANLFIQYLVDHYGVRVLADSLRMAETGIQSINAVLLKQGFKDDFAQIFTNWTVAVLINNCQVSEKYCYFNRNLENLRATPLVNYLPFIGQSTLLVSNTARDWAGNWHKFVGGQGTLKFEFKGNSGIKFRVPYLIQTAVGNFIIGDLMLDQEQTGEVVVEDFGSENISLTVIPVVQNKTAGFSSLEPSRTFSWSATTKAEEEMVVPTLPPLTKPISQMSRAELLSRITEIQKLIVQLQNLLGQLSGANSCSSLDQNLFLGMRDNIQVRCLQEFLKSQGSGIYPEGIISGNFFALTQAAVIRFQEKYSIQATGYVGPITRAKINSLLGQ